MKVLLAIGCAVSLLMAASGQASSVTCVSGILQHIDCDDPSTQRQRIEELCRLRANLLTCVFGGYAVFFAILCGIHSRTDRGSVTREALSGTGGGG